MSPNTANIPIEFDGNLIDICSLNESEIYRRAKILEDSRLNLITGFEYKVAWLVKAITCIDLTTLAGDDTEENVQRLCTKAKHPIQRNILEALGIGQMNVTCGAICVYPARVPDAFKTLNRINPSGNIPIASVATGFPAGQTPLSSRIEEIKYAVEHGASEIDIVINRRHAISGDWKSLYEELVEMKKACGSAHMKSILAVGELPDFTFVYKASMVSMMAGSDFIKTSTGKETVNATIPIGLVMCRAIRDFHAKTGRMIGLKPAGGIRISKDAINWLILVKEELGLEWLNPNLFRIGASGLLSDIEREMFILGYGRHPSPHFLHNA